MQRDDTLHDRSEAQTLGSKAERLLNLFLLAPVHQAFVEQRRYARLALHFSVNAWAEYQVRLTRYRRRAGGHLLWRLDHPAIDYVAANFGERFQSFRKWQPLAELSWEEQLATIAAELDLGERVPELRYLCDFYGKTEDDERLRMLKVAVRNAVNSFWTEHHRSQNRRMEAWFGDFNSDRSRYSGTVRIHHLLCSFGGVFEVIRSTQEFQIYVTEDLLFEVHGGSFDEPQFMTLNDYHQWWSLDLMEHMGKEGAQVCRDFSQFLFLCDKRGVDPTEELRRRGLDF